MRVDHTAYPRQKLPKSKKNQEWKEACVDFFIGKATIGGFDGASNVSKKIINYELYNGRFDRKDLEYVTNPFGVEDETSFPANLHNFNIVRPKIDLLIGEETKRPFNFRITQSNKEATSKMEEEQKKMMLSVIQRMILEGEEPQKNEDGTPQTPEEVIRYMRYSYSDMYEEAAQHMLNYLTFKLDLQSQFMRGWKDALIAGEEVYYVGSDGEMPYVERVNPVFFDCDRDPEAQFIQDGEWACRKMRMTPSSVHDRFKDELSEEDLDEILSGHTSLNSKPSEVNYEFIKKNFGPTNEGTTSDYMDVYHVVWKSFVKVGLVSFQDEMGVPQMIKVSEDYVKSPGEDVEWMWDVEVWEGFRIEEDVYVGIKATDYKELPYIGTIYNNDNSNSVSLMDIMKPIQYMYIIIWYRLDLALARDKGKIINIDVTQIPKSMGIDFNRWATYLSSLGVNLINPYEEGWDVKRQPGSAAQFNQFGSVDLTMANVIDGYINLLAKLEDMVGELSGVSRQRQGSIASNELVGNVERSVVQSSHITEPWFYTHNTVKRQVLTSLLNTSKFTFKDKEKLNYITNDMGRVIFSIPNDLDMHEFDIFVTDSNKESQALEALKSLSQHALSSGASLYEVASMYMVDNISTIKNKLKELDDKRNEREGRAAEANQKAAERALALEEMKIKEELRIKEENNIRDNETRLIMSGMSDNNQLQEDIEKRKLELEDKKIEVEKELSEKKIESAEKIAKDKNTTTKEVAKSRPSPSKTSK